MGQPIIIAVPKGRILDELQPVLKAVGIIPEPDFFDERSRKLQFSTNRADVRLIRVRSFDVPTFVAHGAAQLGICGSDVLLEYDYPDLYSPLDMGIGHCRLSVAGPLGVPYDPKRLSHMRIATKYPNVTRRHFATYGVQAECIKLNGAMELAPALGLAHHIVDLVSSGATLKANGLVEVETIAEISSKLVVNRTAFKTRSEEIQTLLDRFREVLSGKKAA